MATILNSYTFPLDPARVSGLDAGSLLKRKATASADTLTGNILWQWAVVTAGQEIVMEWERMETAFWEELQTCAEAASTYTLNPDIGGTTFTVAVISLEAQGRDPAGMRGVRLTMSVRS